MARFYEYTEKGQVCDQVIRAYRERTGMWPGYTSIQRKDRYVARFYEYREKRQVCDQIIRVYRERTGM